MGSDRFNRGVLAGLAAVVAVLVINALLSYGNVRRLHEDGRRVARTHEALDALADIRAEVNRAEALQRTFLITDDDRHLPPFEAALEGVMRQVGQVGALTGDEPGQLARLPELDDRIWAVARRLRHTLAIRKTEGFDAARAVVQQGEGARRLAELRGLLAEMEGQEQRQLVERQADAERAYAVAVGAGLIAALMGLLALGLFIWLLRRHLAARAREVTERHQAEARERQANEAVVRTLESVPDGFFALDREWRLTYANQAAGRLVGQDPADLIGKDFWRTLPGLVGGAFEPVHRRAMVERVGQSIVSFNAEHARWYEVDSYPAPDGITIFFRDVTLKVEAEQALRRGEAQYRQIVEGNPALICRFRPDGTLTFVNDTYCQTFGKSRAELVGRTFTPLIPEEDLPIVARTMARLAPDMEPYTDEHRVVVAGGAIRWQRWTNKSVGDDGACHEYQAIGIDITEAKQAEEAVRLSEQRWRLALDAAELGAWNVDPTTDALTSDERFRIIFHGSTGPITYEEAFAAVHPEDRPRIRSAVAAATRLDDLVPYAEEYRVIHPDGSIHWVFGKGRVNFGITPTGRRLVSFDGTVMDITARKQAQQRERQAAEAAHLAAEANAKFRAFFEQGSYFACLLATDGTFIEVNRLVIEGAGFRRDDLIGRKFWETAVWTPRAEVADRIRSAVLQAAAGLPFRGESPYFLADGRERIGEVNLVPVTDESGRVLFVAAIGFDVTNRRMVEQEREHLVGQLRDQDRKKDEFLATLAHELRNPLAPIRTGLQVMALADGNPGAVAQVRAMMERQLGQMVRLVDDLLDVSRITRGKLELLKERIPLAGAIADAVETSRPLIEQMGHRLSVTLLEDSLAVDADPTRLAQVFANLLNNAAKYSDHGGRIALVAARRGDHAEVSVRDDGIGIPTDKLASIFEMFSQVDQSLEKSQGGLGIGLTLAKRLVELHGGAVEAKSDGPGRGSEFVVRLPVVAEAPVVPAQGVGTVAAPETSLCILIVDDNRDGADSLAMMLSARGHRTATAYDGRQGVDEATRLRPDVVLLDIGLPGLNGYEACRRIRAQPGGQEMTLIAVTGWGQDEDRRRSREAGFDHHLVKPVAPNALIQLLAQSREERTRMD